MSRLAPDNGRLGTAIMFVLALLGAASIPDALTATRPTTDATQVSPAVPQRMYARLWQDPFRAIENARPSGGQSRTITGTSDDTRAQSSADNSQASRPQAPAPARLQQGSSPANASTPAAALARLAEEIKNRRCAACRSEDGESHGRRDLILMPVLVDNTPWQTDADARIDTRVAVIAGLAANGFYPRLNSQIEYVVVRSLLGPDRGATKLPYEWFDGVRDTEQTGCPPSVLVLWLDQMQIEPFGTFLPRLAALMHELCGAGKQCTGEACTSDCAAELAPFTRVCVLGPTNSDALISLLRAQDDECRVSCKAAACVLSKRTNIYASRPTIPKTSLCKAICPSQLNSTDCTATRFTQIRLPMGGQNGPLLHRLIGTDDILLRLLADELLRRGVITAATTKGEGGRILLISPFNSAYSRAMENTFKDALVKRLHNRYSMKEEEIRGNLEKVLRFKGYSSGLAGSLPRQEDYASGSSALSRMLQPEVRYRPEGRSQMDSIDRLMDELAKDMGQARQDKRPIRAVGVLGGDIYDTLTILHAVRQRLPHAVCFTTDMHAFYELPEHRRATRNLLVASHFGLRLGEKLHETPPLRNGYQTGTYFATRYALETPHANDEHSKEPHASDEQSKDWYKELKQTGPEFRCRLYEIGRSGAIDITPDGWWGTNPPTFKHCNILFGSEERRFWPDVIAMVAALIGLVIAVVLVWLMRPARRHNSLDEGWLSAFGEAR